MKIVILTDSSERHFYFCNRIINECDSVVGVFLGTKQKPEGLFSTIRKYLRRKIFLRSVFNKFINLIFLRYGNQFELEKLESEELYFGGSKDKFNSSKSDLFCETVTPAVGSINNKAYIEKIKKLKPDVIIVMGSCLIGKEIINISKHVINMHTGLSPYYRGGYTNLWPFLRKDYGFFGVTIHAMSSGIDSGAIIYSARPDVCLGDSYGSINSKAIILGTDLMIATMGHISENDLTTKSQWLSGNLFHNYHFNYYIAYKYLKNKNTFTREYCRLERDNKLPVLQLVSNGIIYDN